MRATMYSPVALPANARELMKFKPEVATEIDRLTAEAMRDGRWACSEDRLFDLKSPAFWAYWIHKTAHPITRAMRGAGIEERIEPFRRTRFELRPAGFECEREWSFSAVGDLMCTGGLEQSREHLYAGIDDLVFDADIAYANLESTLALGRPAPLTISTDETPMINLTRPQYETLVAHSGRRYDVVHLANNHILDCGEEGVRETLSQLKADGIAQVGVNESAEAASRPRITEHQGLQIGWVAHTFSVNFKPFPPGKAWLVNMTPFHVVRKPDTSIIEEQVRACRAAGCDLVFVSLHWGLEFEFYPHPDQLQWAYRFADAGADLIIGHHPHVAQPVEIYRTQHDPLRQVPIIYSLGNLTPVFSHPATVMSLVAHIQLEKGHDQSGPRTLISALQLTPVALVSGKSNGCEVLQLRRVADLMTTAWQGDKGYIDQIAAYSDLVVGHHWRTELQPHDTRGWC